MWYLRAMRHYADFSGRARRIEFWEFAGGLGVLGVVAAVIDAMLTDYYGQSDRPFELAVTLIHLVPSCAVAARRSHDLDRSGWLSLLGFVPFVGFAMLVFWAFPGTLGPNRFGPEPADEPDGGPPLESHPNTTRAWEPRTDHVTAATPRPPTDPGAARLDPLVAVAEVERLADLLYAGALTDAEFESLKRRLISGEPAR